QERHLIRRDRRSGQKVDDERRRGTRDVLGKPIDVAFLLRRPIDGGDLGEHSRRPYPKGLSAVRGAARGLRRIWAGGFPMPRGDKRKYTDKQKRQAEHIEDGYKERGMSSREAARRAWATVNA